jgi:hypothetical protein
LKKAPKNFCLWSFIGAPARQWQSAFDRDRSLSPAIVRFDTVHRDCERLPLPRQPKMRVAEACACRANRAA